MGATHFYTDFGSIIASPHDIWYYPFGHIPNFHIYVTEDELFLKCDIFIWGSHHSFLILQDLDSEPMLCFLIGTFTFDITMMGKVLFSNLSLSCF